MKSKVLVICTVTLFSLFIFAGCSKKQDETTAPSQMSGITVSPADQSANIRLDEKVILSFTAPVDRKIVESSFHLISQKDMADSACPYSKTMNHGDMSMAMMDTMKMNHLDYKHSMTGKFTWNSNSTQCIFTPDSLMTPKMTYMIHFGKSMMDMMNQSMGGMMGGSGSMMNGMINEGQMKGHMLMHFSTMAVASTGGGHEDHH